MSHGLEFILYNIYLPYDEKIYKKEIKNTFNGIRNELDKFKNTDYIQQLSGD